MLQRNEQQRVRLLFGTTGSGKTHKLRELLGRESRCFLLDLMADPKFDNWGVLVDTLEDALRLAAKTDKFRVRIQSDNLDRFEFLCRCLVKRPHGWDSFRNVLVAVDELAILCTTPGGGSVCPENLKNLIRLGRHTGSAFIATTQRPPDIPPFIRSQAKEQFLFQMHEPADLDVFRKRVPNIERVIQLNRGEFILWRPDTMQTIDKFLPTTSDDSSDPSPTESLPKS